MKLSEIVHQLRTLIPKYTTAFSTNIGISSISASSGTVTVETSSAHGLSVGKAVTLSSFNFNNPISSVVTDGLVHTIETQNDHDLTENWHEEVTLSGFTDSVWNDTHTLLSVPNRKTFTIRVNSYNPTLNGNEVLLEDRSYGVNGQFEVLTVPDSTHFTVGDSSIFDGDYTDGVLSTKVEIYGVIDVERALQQYTEKSASNLVMFVTPADAEVSQDRNARSDATATLSEGTNLRLRIIDGFMVFVVINTTQDIGAVSAVDQARHVLLGPILKSLYGARFSSGLTGEGDFKTVFTGHGVAEYNRAYLAYRYDFEMPMDLISDDAVDPTLTRAFRDINYTQNVGTGIDDMTATIDLDEIKQAEQYSDYSFYDTGEGASGYNFADVADDYTFDNLDD